MFINKIKNGDIFIELIDSNEKLNSLAEFLSTKPEFSFDTEFDRFKREYGFKLFLLQIYDGEYCYLIDPLMINNLKPLWCVFENPAICKVAYSCSEDIQLLKINGCNPKNIFDVQIASLLCNSPANSFAKLIQSEFGIILDKSKQTSNWHKRPIDIEQLIYASNDVVHLLKLKRKFLNEAQNKNVLEMLREENKLCEVIPVIEFSVKLSQSQIQRYSEHHKEKLLELLVWRDKIGQKLNIPPYFVVSDALLEEIIKNKEKFIAHPNLKGFHKKVTQNNNFMGLFFSIVRSIDQGINYRSTVKTNRGIYELDGDKERMKIIHKTKYEPIKEEVFLLYGPIAGEYILRGFKKFLESGSLLSNSNLRDYQKKVIEDISGKLAIVL